MAEAKRYKPLDKKFRAEIDEHLYKAEGKIRKLLPEQADHVLEKIREYAINICLLAQTSKRGVQNYMRLVLICEFLSYATELAEA